MVETQTVGDVSLVRYAYDALGRRVETTFDPDDPNEAVTVRYYYDGVTVIEERDGADALTRYHVNGTQQVDEPVATYTVGAAKRGGSFTYHLPGQNGSIIGSGSSDGTVTRLDYDTSGSFTEPPGPSGYHHDADADLDVDLHDLMRFQHCFGRTGVNCRAVHDFDAAGVSDGVIDADDWEGVEYCQSTVDQEPDVACAITRSRASSTPPTGTFALHGRSVDVLSDGKVLYYFRARYYDPAHARWLQRDPSGYADGANLYEAFKNNAARFTDPMGEEVWATYSGPKETLLGGQRVWAVEYQLHEDGVGLGAGAGLYQAWNGARNWLGSWFGYSGVANDVLVETIDVGTEYFSYTEDPKALNRLYTMAENQRAILERGYIANRDVGNLRQGIIVLGTTAVALPVAHVTAPAATAMFGTSVTGSAVGGAFTGSVAFGLGSGGGEALAGGDTAEVMGAAWEGAKDGAAFGFVFGVLGRLNVYLTGSKAFQLVRPLNTGSTIRVTQFYDPARGNFGPGSRFALSSKPPASLGERIFDGRWWGETGFRTWVSPMAASEQSLSSRFLTGRGGYVKYVEFSATQAELSLGGGTKNLLGAYQRAIPGRVDLTTRAPVFGEITPRLLGAGQGATVIGGVAGGDHIMRFTFDY